MIAQREKYLFVQAIKGPEQAIPVPLKLNYINFFFQNLQIEKENLSPLNMNVEHVRVFEWML